MAAEHLVFVDESSTSIALTRRYARAPRGHRAPGRVPRNQGTPTTLLAALSLDGLQATMTLPGAVNGASFTLYVREVLCPTLRPGQLVVLDNLSSHKGAAVRAAIEAVGCHLWFLPSYSPDFSPIEHTFSKLKAALRAVGARTQDALDQAIAQAIDQVTPTDAHGWFTHCGYPPPSPLPPLAQAA